MAASDRRLTPSDWLSAHAVDVAFGLLALGWLAYILRLTGEFSFWSDDLFLVEQGGSWSGLFESYNNHLSVVILSIYRASAELAGLSYTPIMVVGALSLLAVPVTYYATTRRQLTPPIAAVLALSLLWFEGTNLRPSGLNHYLALVGGIVCAAALNRGRRADGVLAAALVFSLGSAGGGVVVAGACLAHNALVRPHLRRWIAVVVPFGLWVAWWLLVADTSALPPGFRLTGGDAARVVRDLCLEPFYAASLGVTPLAYLLAVAFLVHGAMQLRKGLAAGANFVAWSAAMVMWAYALVQSRGILADPQLFRYAYLSLGFALLAVVPREVIHQPALVPGASRRWALLAAGVVLVLGGVRGLAVRSELHDFARGHAERGREAEGTMLVLGLGPDAIPDSTPISFFGIFQDHGSASRVRTLLDRYGSPYDATAATADQDLVDLEIVRVHVGGSPGGSPDELECQPLTAPFLTAGVDDHGFEDTGPPPVRSPVRLWSSESFVVELRRFGDDWVRLAELPPDVTVALTLPALNSKRPWEIRADGACDLSQADPDG